MDTAKGNTISDNQLFEQVKQHDVQAFEILFKRHYEALCIHAVKYLREQEASEEVVQDVFCKLWEQRSSIEITGSVKSYCYRMVQNRCLNLIQHIEVREQYKTFNQASIDAQQQVTEESYLETELQQLIQDKVEAMPEMRKKVFQLSRYEGLKYKEIATQLGISIKTVEIHMSKALQYLRTELAAYLPLILLWLNNFFSEQ